MSFIVVGLDGSETSREGRALVAAELAVLEESYGGGCPVPVESKVVLGHAGVGLKSAPTVPDEDDRC